MKKPRIGLFEPPNSMDAGWTKWVLERYGFEFTSLNTPDITGNLKDRIDVLVVGDEARGVLPGGAGFGRAPAPTPDDDVRIKALDAFVQRDVDRAYQVGHMDDEVDVLYDRVYRDLVDIMVRDPSTVESCTRLLWVAHNLERIGDRATNIAERVVFTVTGMLPEMDVSSY